MLSNKSKIRCAVISFSANPDMALHLFAKCNSFDKNIFDFYCSKESLEKNPFLHGQACPLLYNGRNRITLRLLIDIMIVLPKTLLFLFCRKHTHILFDSEHIMNIFVSFIARFFGVKSIFSIHDLTPHPGKMYYFHLLYNFVTRKYLASGYICFSRDSENILNHHRPTRAVKLLGFDSNLVNSLGGQYILFFGRIEPYKGLDQLVEIIRSLRNRKNMTSFVVAGAGYDKSLAELRMIEKVDVRNRFVDENELNDLIASAICVILPYKSATQSGVVLKANAMGVPVICFNVGALSEYIEDGTNGYVINAGDISGMVNAIEDLILPNEIMLKKRTIDNYRRLFSHSSTIQQYEETIVDLAKSC